MPKARVDQALLFTGSIRRALRASLMHSANAGDRDARRLVKRYWGVRFLTKPKHATVRPKSYSYWRRFREAHPKAFLAVMRGEALNLDLNARKRWYEEAQDVFRESYRFRYGSRSA